MTRSGHYAIIFILAFMVATMLWGIERHYTMKRIHVIIKSRIVENKCWRDKYIAARFGWPDERSCGRDD